MHKLLRFFSTYTFQIFNPAIMDKLYILSDSLRFYFFLIDNLFKF